MLKIRKRNIVMNTTFDWLLKLKNNLKTNQISYSSFDRVKNYSGVMVEFAGSGLRILTKNSFRIIVKPLLVIQLIGNLSI